MGSSGASGLTFALRNGATCTLRDGVLSIGDATYPLRDVVFAGLVADTSVPVAPGAPPAPAVALRFANGASSYLTPVEQADARRLLQAIHAARPDMPPPGYAPGYPPYGAPVYGGYPPRPAGQDDTDRTLAVLCHLSVFFAPLILPLIIWLAMPVSHPYASRQAKQAFWFHLVFGVLTGALFLVAYVYMMSMFFSTATGVYSSGNPYMPAIMGMNIVGIILFYAAIAVFGLANVIFSIIGAVQAGQGKPFHYPLLGWI